MPPAAGRHDEAGGADLHHIDDMDGTPGVREVYMTGVGPVPACCGDV
jgi:hypothetical protein